jgi:hypothetical protein
MKLKQNSIMSLAAVCAASSILSLGAVRADHHEKGDHDDHKHEEAEHKGHELVGPNKGKVLHQVEPHAELFVTKDRKIKITFLDDHGKVVAAKDQKVTVVCGKRSSPTKLTFKKDGDSLLSEKSLPDGKMIPTVLQIKVTPEAKTTVIRLNLDLSLCPGCKLLEYACTCDHHDDHEDHDDHDDHDDHGDHKDHDNK